MQNKTIGLWLVGSTIASIFIAVLNSDGGDYDTLLGVVALVMIVFAIIGGLRLQK